MRYFTDFWPFQKTYPTNHASENHHICNFASGHARDFLVSNPRFLGMGNHLVPLAEALEWAEGAVGGQGPLQGVNF